MENTQIQNCPCCPRHCPIDAVSCHRGEEIVEKIKNGETIGPEAYQKEHGQDDTHGGHRHHGSHDHHKDHGEHRSFSHHGEDGHHKGHDHHSSRGHAGEDSACQKEAGPDTYRGVIFDLDGVICFTDEYHYQAWKTLADRINVPFDRTVNNRLRGVSRMASLEIILEKSEQRYTQDEKDAMASEKNETYKKLLEQMSEKDLSDEVKHVLDTLRGRGLLLAIGSSSRNTAFILRQIGLDGYFDAVSDGNCITHSKPDPEVFVKAAQMLGLNPGECLVVEDAVSGAQAGHAGGMKVACVGDAARSGAGDYNMENIGELLVVAKKR